MKQQTFFQSVIRIAIPVALQSMLQSSFSMIDQIMVGQLGSTSIAAVGVAGKFAFLYSVVTGAVTAIAGIGMGFCGTRKAGCASCGLKDCAFRRS